MAKIQAVTDEMIARAGVIGRNISRIQNSQNNILKIFRNMGREFGGRIPSLMIQHMLAMSKEYMIINRDLNKYKDLLEEAARSYEWSDAEAARWAQSMGSRG